MIKSFDIFDTLITRDVFKPSDIFYLLGKKLKEKSVINITPLEFMQLRIKAEAIAREKSNFEEITLDEIYDEVNKILSLSYQDIERIKNFEMQMELKLSSTIDENIKTNSNNSIIISDTYHDEKFISSLLNKNFIKYKDLFISSKHKKTKHYGSLYDKVLEKYNIILHVGDNYHSDYKIAQSKNISAIHYSNSTPTLYEKLIYEYEKVPLDFRVLLSGCMKSTRLNKYYKDEHLQSIHELSSNIIAPFLFLYVSWVIKKAKEIGLDSLYFIARDGQILYAIAKQIIEEFNLDLEIKYLYGSRKAWHLPAVTEINDEVIDWIFDPTAFLSIQDICKRAEIKLCDIQSEISIDISCNENLAIDEREKIKKVFLSNPNIKNTILAKAKEKRNLVIEYLKQEGFEPNKMIGIVDVGWRGRQQVSLSKLLKLGNIYPKKGLYGFYVSLINPVKPYELDKFISFFDKDLYKDILNYPALYESFVAATHGSCVGYKKSNTILKPILREEINTHMIEWGLEVQQYAITLFTKKLSKHLKNFDVNISNEQELSSLLLYNFFHFPLEKHAIAYGKIKVFEDQEESIHTNLCIKLRLFQILKITFLRKSVINHNVWKEGSVVISTNNKIIKNILLKLLVLRKKLGARFREIA